MHKQLIHVVASGLRAAAIFSVVVLLGLPSLSQTLVASKTYGVSPGQWLVITNASTNAWYIGAIRWSTTNNVATSGQVTYWWQRGMISNKLIQMTFTDGTNSVWGPEVPIYFAQADIFRMYNGTTTGLLTTLDQER